MICCYLSDLHISYPSTQFIQIPKVDVLVLAGDIFENTLIAEECFMDWAKQAKHILYVMGNHEYWFHPNMAIAEQKYDKIIQRCNDKIGYDCIHRLNHFKYGEFNFIGATLWTEMITHAGEFAGDDITISDNRFIIDYAGNPLTPTYTRSIHHTHLKHIDSKIDPTMTNIVVTHHAPSWQQQDRRFLGSDIGHFFYSNLDEWISHRNIHAWIHGHVHIGKITRIHNTNIVCNPRGRVLTNIGECENPHFNINTCLQGLTDE